MGLLDGGLPSEVVLNGVAVPIVGCGHREGIATESLDLRDPDDRMALLVLHFVPPESDDPIADLPKEVLDDEPGAIKAVMDWHTGASDTVSYGKPRKRPPGARRRTFDWDQDAAIIASDFQRLYRIDLLDPSTSLHWYRFTALFLAASRVEGSLIGQAIGARGEMRSGLKGEQLDRELERRNAWSLRETEAEMVERLRREFAR